MSLCLLLWYVCLSGVREVAQDLKCNNYIYINYMNVYLYLVIIVINVLLEENFH